MIRPYPLTLSHLRRFAKCASVQPSLGRCSHNTQWICAKQVKSVPKAAWMEAHPNNVTAAGRWKTTVRMECDITYCTIRRRKLIGPPLKNQLHIESASTPLHLSVKVLMTFQFIFSVLIASSSCILSAVRWRYSVPYSTMLVPARFAVLSLRVLARVPRWYFGNRAVMTCPQIITPVEQRLRQIEVCNGCISNCDITSTVSCSDHSRLIVLRYTNEEVCKDVPRFIGMVGGPETGRYIEFPLKRIEKN